MQADASSETNADNPIKIFLILKLKDMKFFKYPKLNGWQIFMFACFAFLSIASIVYGFGVDESVISATLVNTLMQPLRSKDAGAFDKNEVRGIRAGALNFFKQEAALRPLFDQETLNNITASYGNSVVTPVMDAKTVTVATPYTRSCAIVDSENTSQLITLTFAAYGWAFSMTPSTHANNNISYQKDFDKKLKEHLIKFESLLDTACVAQLETDKNAYFPAELIAYYAALGDALRAPQANKDDFYNQVEAIMATADFYDTTHIVAATKHMPMIRKASAQGQSNDENLSWQFGGSGSDPSGQRIRPFNFWPTNRLANGVGVESTAYLVSEGSVFIGNRNDHDSIAGHRVGDQKEWGVERMPMIDMDMGTFYQKDCADRNAIAGAATAGNTRSLVEGFEFSTDIVLASAYNSDSVNRYSPIIKAEILA